MGQRTLLVTGASGNLGRQVVELLLAAGGDRVVAGTRDPAKLADLAAKGAEVRRLDFDDPASLAEAFRGVDRALIVSTDTLDHPDGRAGQHGRAIEAARAAGVKHLVYTSLTNPVEGSAVALAPDHRLTEAALAASGIPYTALRNDLYAELLLGSLPQAIASGQLATAQGEGAIAYVTREDCARAAAAALTDGHAGTRILEITGPEALTGADVAALASELSGKPVTFVPVPPAALTEALLGAGLPAPVASLIVSFDVAASRGELGTVTGDLAALTGRAGTRVRDFLAANLPRG